MDGSKRDKIPIPYPWSIILKIDYKITIVIYSSEPNQRKISTKSPTRRSFQTKFKVIQNEEPGQRFKSSTSKGNINSPDLTNPLPMHRNSGSSRATRFQSESKLRMSTLCTDLVARILEPPTRPTSSCVMLITSTRGATCDWRRYRLSLDDPRDKISRNRVIKVSPPRPSRGFLLCLLC